MAPKIFITGGTGYVGGSVLDAIVEAHPEYEVTALLRKIPDDFSSRYPGVKIVQGDYDSADILSQAASEAEVVVHNGDSDHEPAINALICGLLERPTPGFLIHLSGTGIVSDYHSKTYLGKQNPKIWSDIDDYASISSLPDNAPHRNTEKILNAAIAEHGDKINIAIMCPPDIYGRGRGLGKSVSAYVPIFLKEVKELGRVFYYGEGTNTRSYVHIDDLLELYLKVVEAAVAGGEGAEWGSNGYYFASTQEHNQICVSTIVGRILRKYGVVGNEEPVEVTLQQLDAMFQIPKYPGLSRYLFGANSRTRADRAKKLFGYQAKAPGLMETLGSDIKDVLCMEEMRSF
ncbi:NAD(P)-binding protein [Lojkania enalia]|uniref:NAD(P)-binding protein n=1 Tax=Lojkania enalia TaxID=147567 RepID=A0A9P4KHD7_9PLEO|nr:NAD(P)-binding protein [Didymosphaeria enalia]